MAKLMASHDVTEKLNRLESKLSLHSELHKQNAETLREVKNVLVSNAKISQQLVGIDRRLDKIDERFEKVDERFEKVETKTDKNREKIFYWSGGLAAVVLVFGMITTYVKIDQAAAKMPPIAQKPTSNYLKPSNGLVILSTSAT
jgi:hypothetical protein